MNTTQAIKASAKTDTGAMSQEIAAAAKLVRSDVAAAITRGDLPADCKVSVRIDRKGAESLAAFITLPVARCSAEACAAGRANGASKPWLTRVAYIAELTVQGIVDAHNPGRRFHASVAVREAA